MSEQARPALFGGETRCIYTHGRWLIEMACPGCSATSSTTTTPEAAAVAETRTES